VGTRFGDRYRHRRREDLNPMMRPTRSPQ